MPIKNERSGRLKGIRLDVALVERGLSPSRERAQALILAGVVRVDGETERRSSRAVSPSQPVSVDAPPRYVSRGGYKLEKALDTFAVDPSGLVALDAGASTGGFTDCLLQRNCARVYAVDVGYGQIDYRLREDARVVVLERTNVRYLEHLPEPVDLVVADVSFISLRLVIPAFVRLSAPGAPILTLIKPQFEAGRGEVGRKGVVKDPAIHRRVIQDLARWGSEAEIGLVDVTFSPLRGPAGNIEFLGLWSAKAMNIVTDDAIARVVSDAHQGLVS